MGTYEIFAATTIHATPAQVWGVLDDFAGWTGWMPAMDNITVELLSDGPPRAGYMFRLRGRLAHAELEVTDYTPLRRATRFAVHVPLLPPMEGDNSCELLPQNDGSYRMERLDHIHLNNRYVMEFLDATQRQRFERLAVEFILALKNTAMSRAAPAHAPVYATEAG